MITTTQIHIPHLVPDNSPSRRRGDLWRAGEFHRLVEPFKLETDPKPTIYHDGRIRRVWTMAIDGEVYSGRGAVQLVRCITDPYGVYVTLIDSKDQWECIASPSMVLNDDLITGLGFHDLPVLTAGMLAAVPAPTSIQVRDPRVPGGTIFFNRPRHEVAG